MNEESLKPVGRQRWFGNYDAKMLLALSSKYSPYFQERQKNKNLVRKSSSADSITSQNTSRRDSQSGSSSLNNSFIHGVVTNAVDSGISTPTKVKTSRDQQISPLLKTSLNFNSSYYPRTPDLLDSNENSLKQGVLHFNPSNESESLQFQDLNTLLQQNMLVSQKGIIEDEEENRKEQEDQIQQEQTGDKGKKSRNRNRNKKKMNKYKQNPLAKKEEQVEDQYDEYIYYPQYYQNETFGNQEMQQQVMPQEIYYEPNAQFVPNFYQNLSSFELQNMLQNAHTLVKDQLGCRLLQHKLDETNEAEANLICSYLLPYITQLSVDTFGNYLVQKLIEAVNQEYLSKIVEVLQSVLIENCLDSHGTRVVQKILVQAKIPLLYKVIDIIKPHIPSLSEELNGNHVIQKCLSLKHPHNQFIYDSVCQNIMIISSHKHGCCVIQKCIDTATEEQVIQVVNKVVSDAIQLVQDPFGNYVIQHILDKKCYEFNNRIAIVFNTQIVQLSTHKFSSNVIEKVMFYFSVQHLLQTMFSSK